MSHHKQLIGNHPSSPNIFEKWLDCEDLEPTDERCIRVLSGKLSSTESDLVDWLAKKLINHHYDQSRLDRLKLKYKELGFSNYAEQNRKLPRADRTKKGNATEIILIEYIESCQNRTLIHSYKLRYNPNVDQSIKGDDVLLLDILKDNDKHDLKIYLGEAKFRQAPSKTAVENISKALEKNKLPLSYSYLVDTLGKQPDQKELADTLDNFLIKDIKDKGNICYTGLLLSNTQCRSFVEKHFKNDNPDLIMLSMGIDNPQELFDAAYKKAEELILNPSTL